MKNFDNLQIMIVGTGYVGLTTGLCFSYLGYRVICVDKNEEIIEKLKRGQSTIYEPGVEELLEECGSNIEFSPDMKDYINTSDVIIIAVGTPSKENGDTDLSYVEDVATEIGKNMQKNCSPVIVNKSTVPVGSARRVEMVIQSQLEKRGVQCSFSVASNPEFLREGSALFDAFYPDRIVVGSDHLAAINILRQVYTPLLEQTFISPRFIPRPEGFVLPPYVTTKPTSAELIKYAANSFLSVKISFINEFAGISDRVGADIQEVARGIGLDKRIGHRFLMAGLGWGGSCFPKDTQAILHMGQQYGYHMPLTKAAIEVNSCQRKVAIEKLQSILKVIRGSIIGVMGLSFKPNTDDIREAPSIDIIRTLLEMGAGVKAYDPVAMKKYRSHFPQQDIIYSSSVYELAKNCDALLLVTDWEEFSHVDWHKVCGVMRQKVIVDGRNLLPRKRLEELGFIYSGIGC